MKIISNNFREALRGIRELNALVTYQSEGVSKVLTTELEQNLASELGNLLGTELGDIILDNGSINMINPMYNVELFKTICKSVALDIKNEIPINTWINVKIGVLVNSEYEYIDYGKYYVTECKYQADTNSYLVTAYDKMIEAMKPYDLSVTYPITIKNLLINIFTKLGWTYELDTFVNQDKTISKDLFSDLDLTYRDVLDNISQVIVGNIGFEDNIVKVKYINPLGSSTLIPFEIPQTLNTQSVNNKKLITEYDLKDTNVTLDKKYGPVNSILITSNNVVLNNLEDSVSVETNGKIEYDFKDNLILMNDSDTFIDNMFEAIKGLEFYLYDFDTYGILCFDPLDEIVVEIGNNEYKTLVLNDDIKLSQGLEETMYVEEPEATTKEYIAVDKNEKKLNNALISIDKANAEIVLKVDSQGKLAKVSLDGDADEGTEVNISANSIGLEGETIDLTAKNINFIGDITAGSNITLTDTVTEMGFQQFEISRGGFQNLLYSNKIDLGYTRNKSGTYSNVPDIYIGTGQTSYELSAGLRHMTFSDGSVSSYLEQGLDIWGNTSSNSTFRFDDGDGGYLQISGGNIIHSEPFSPSDKRLKENIKNVSVDWIDELKIKQFNYKVTPSKKEIGLIAQDYIDKDFSKYFIGDYETKGENYYAIKYQSITNALIQYCQELKQRVNDLEQRIENLERNDK